MKYCGIAVVSFVERIVYGFPAVNHLTSKESFMLWTILYIWEFYLGSKWNWSISDKYQYHDLLETSKSDWCIYSRSKGKVLEAKGRHDPCVLPRAVPIVESMAALVMADYLLIKRTNKK